MKFHLIFFFLLLYVQIMNKYVFLLQNNTPVNDHLSNLYKVHLQ